jgi:glutamyl-tRNA synthetase
MEDLDPDRSRSYFASQLMVDLRWLALDWDEGPDVGGPYAPYGQDQRREQYAQALMVLEQRDLVYTCYCSRAEVRAAASAPHGSVPAEQCANQCWSLSSQQRSVREAEGRRPCVRIRAPRTMLPTEFEDMCQGVQSEQVSRSAGDFVLRRADGVHAYQLAVVVDDGSMGISHVVRGADLLPSTARQIWLHQILGYQPPVFAHVPLLVDSQGVRLSKRHASLEIAEIRAKGVKPTMIIGWLATWAGLIPAFENVQPRDLIGLLDLRELPRQNIVVPQRAI